MPEAVAPVGVVEAVAPCDKAEAIALCEVKEAVAPGAETGDFSSERSL